MSPDPIEVAGAIRMRLLEFLSLSVTGLGIPERVGTDDLQVLDEERLVLSGGISAPDGLLSWPLCGDGAEP